MEFDNHVKAGEEFRPAGLAASEKANGGKVLEVLVIGNNGDWVQRSFKVMSTNSKGLIDC